MLPPPPTEHLSLPAVNAPAPRSGFPWVATGAPVAMSLAIWAVTGSVFSLLFAALGPVVAVGSALDARRQRRSSVRRERAATLDEIARLRQRIEQLHVRERDRLERLAPTPELSAESRRVSALWAEESARDAPLPVLVGRADLAPIVELSGSAAAPDAPPAGADLSDAISALRGAAAAVRDAPRVLDARDGIGVIGPPEAARAVARSIVVQLLARLSPASATLEAPTDERWAADLPHAVRFTDGPSGAARFRLAVRADEPLTVAWANDVAELPSEAHAVVALGALDDGRASDVPHALGALRARQLAVLLAAAARDRGLAVNAHSLPELVTLTELLTDPLRHGAPGLRAPIGVDRHGAVELDLVRDGPHAVIAGTTGTGKSELLVSWVLAMASRHPPTTVNFLLIDFKGGAAFAPLAGLPHLVGVVTDLDARGSRRAIDSLQAELRRRELLLAERGARSIDELGGELARLVIVVDEFAAVVSGQPELHELFADLAARGRSLGLHLVLCTQRPSGVIRDGVLANVTLRLSLRVTDRGDSLAMIGSDAAAQLPAAPRGRAVVVDGSGVTRTVQLALAAPADVTRVIALGGEPPAPVWCAALPELLTLEDLDLDPDPRDGQNPGIPFGRLDLPVEQRQPTASYRPEIDGHLLVLGAARSGRTTTLATLAADLRCRVLPGDPAEAWTVLDELVAHPPVDRQVILIDDLDVLIDRIDPEGRQDFLELLGRLARESRALTLVATAQRLNGPLHRIAGLFDSRLLLRQSSRDEHILAGGDGAGFDPRLPPGAGMWRAGSDADATIQVAISPSTLPEAVIPELPRVRVESSRPTVIVAARPRELATVLNAPAARHARRTALPPRVVELGGSAPADPAVLAELLAAPKEPVVLIGDPEAWQAEWALLAAMRREHPLVLFGCTAAELRAVARTREHPPPRGTRPGECWLVESGTVRRAILDP